MYTHLTSGGSHDRPHERASSAMMMAMPMGSRRSRRLLAAARVTLLAVLVLGLYLIYAWIDIRTLLNPQRIVEGLERVGPIAPVVLIFVMAAAVVISPIPSVPLDVAAGMAFGPVQGTIYAVAGAEVGAVTSFWIARALGREALTRLLRTNVHLCERCSDRYLVGFIVLARLVPVFSFDLVSYGAGLTNISFRAFALATLVGMIPPTLALTAFGSGLVWGDPTWLVPGLALVGLLFVIPHLIKRFPRLRMGTFHQRPETFEENRLRSSTAGDTRPTCVSCGRNLDGTQSDSSWTSVTR